MFAESGPLADSGWFGGELRYSAATTTRPILFHEVANASAVAHGSAAKPARCDNLRVLDDLASVAISNRPMPCSHSHYSLRKRYPRVTHHSLQRNSLCDRFDEDGMIMMICCTVYGSVD